MKQIYSLVLGAFLLIGLQVKSQETWRNIKPTYSFGGPEITNLIKKDDGSILFAHNGKIKEFKNNSIIDYTYQMQGEYPSVLEIDGEKNIWAFPSSNAFNSYVLKMDKNGIVTKYSDVNGLNSNVILGMVNIGNKMFFNTLHDGLFLYSNGTINLFDQDVSFILEKLNADEVVYYSNSKLYRTDGVNRIEINVPSKIKSILSVSRIRDNELSVYTRYTNTTGGEVLGMFRFKNGHFISSSDLKEYRKYFEDPDGNIWEIRDNGRVVIKNTIPSEFNFFSGLLATEVFDIEFKDHEVIIASDEGLFIGTRSNEDNSYATLRENELRPVFNSIGEVGAKRLLLDDIHFSHHSGASLLSNSKLIFGGYDNSGQLNVSSEAYDFNNNYPESDFIPGVLNDNSLARVWKVSKEEIDFHIANYTQPNYSIPDGLKNWPANGNVNGLTSCVAPFYDVNGDGLYDAEDGDFPFIKGDEAIYAVYNDNSPIHRSNLLISAPFNIEIHMMAYVINSNDVSIDNTVFVNYKLINKSTRSYTDFYLGMYSEFLLGGGADDYCGSDSTNNLYYVYNKDNMDEGNTVNQGFSSEPPAFGVTFLNQPLKSAMSLFDLPGYNNSVYNNLRGFWNNGEPMVIGGNGYQDATPPPHVETKFIFHGNPSVQGEWSELNKNFPSGKRNMMGGTGPFTLNSGESLEFDLAYVYARSSGGNHLDNINELKLSAQNVKQFYDNQSFPDFGTSCSLVGIEDKQAKQNTSMISVAPNPSNGQFSISSSQIIDKVIVYSIDGRKVIEQQVGVNQGYLNLEGEATGVYFVHVEVGNKVEVAKIVIQ